MNPPLLAAITMDDRGGGVAAVSRLVRTVFEERWGSACLPVTLLDDARPSPSLESSVLARLQFGAGVATAQVTGRSAWVFCTHLSVAQVQRFVPPPVRRPFAIFLHGVEIWRPLPPHVRRVLQRARLLVANSSFTAARVSDIHPDLGPIAVCPLALPRADALDRATESLALEVGPRAVLVVGRMLSDERYKGHDELLEAWPGVVRRVPEARLVFVGEGDDEIRLQRKAQALGVAASAIFTGFVSRAALHDLYERAAVFAMPSRNEGFGLVYLEAMSHGLPCIGSTADAAREVVEHNVTGYLVHQQDRVALTDRLVRLLTDEERRRDMGARGRQRFEERFTYRRFADRLLSLIDDAFPSPARAELADADARGN